MATAEDKIEAVLKEVKSLTVGQLKMTEKVDDLHKRSLDNTKLSTEIAEEIKDLRSRLEALEALSVAPTKAPLRDDEERAKGHRTDLKYQGDDEGTQLPHHSLVKGENQHSKFRHFHVDPPGPSNRRQDTHNIQFH
ncbi:unnamed protein product [Urochloa humidicola]